MAPNEDTFYTRHGLTEIADDRALHCINCDHECPILSSSCCECGLNFHVDLNTSDTYPVRPRHYYAPRERRRVEYAFPKFVDLPKEIRLLIWECALPGPRVVPFDLVLFDQKPGNMFSWGFRTQASIVHLQVCQESYMVASKIYQKYLLTDSPYSGVWFNHQLDTIYINHSGTINAHKPLPQVEEFTENAEAFAIFFKPDVLYPRTQQQLQVTRPMIHTAAVDTQLSKLIHLFKNVKTVTLVSRRHDADDKTDLVIDYDRPDIDDCLQFYQEEFDEKLDGKFCAKMTRYAAAIDTCLSHSRHGLGHRLNILGRVRGAGMVMDLNDTSLDTSLLPEIKHAVVTTSYLRKKLEDSRRAYEEQKAMVMGIEID